MYDTETLSRIAEVIGAEQFSRLCNSIPETIRKGRLRHWQEQLLSSVTDALGIKIETATQLQQVFDTADEISIHVTRETFLERPYEYFHNEHVEIESDWFRDAWQLQSFRDSISYELVRSVSKTGGFELADDTLARIAPVLESTPAIELYKYIRDQSHRVESEWRSEFVDAFPSIADQLPPVSG